MKEKLEKGPLGRYAKKSLTYTIFEDNASILYLAVFAESSYGLLLLGIRFDIKPSKIRTYIEDLKNWTQWINMSHSTASDFLESLRAGARIVQETSVLPRSGLVRRTFLNRMTPATRRVFNRMLKDCLIAGVR